MQLILLASTTVLELQSQWQVGDNKSFFGRAYH